MKKVFMVLGVVSLVVVLAMAGIGIFTWYKSSQYKDTAVPYIKATVPELSKWDPEVIKGYMAPEGIKDVSDENFVKIIRYLSKLGALLSMEEPSFSNIYTGSTLEGGSQTIVTYTIDATYEKGDAEITMTLLDLGNTFQVYKFHISSMALVE
ncbi:hypothetical protein MJO47_05320 [Desulfuromonas sp. KJ2020]|uniref:hypothetical protein n=1 Tax=Desulfuromonas sp. KJ2020 TaxID=2919173 RepID=UPI0020A7F7F7|nr:hypothetical protein [Desulfuromonas sp. KJ2020]MCP3176516.1 hypothetical protein [Desulfuromonas sp. KJ2020]